MKILFACTGNTCRSPMAELVFRARCKDESITCASCGFSAFPGDTITPEAAAALAEIGIDSGAFRSSTLTMRAVEDADEIYVMTAQHREILEAVLDSGSMKKVHLLGGGVSDPYGQGIGAYRACLSQISAAVNGILQELGADGR
ncbi:low molecular weight phosphatase family protein [Bittarella massiliensis (ex Durand et al. 2017)]|uniref:arsenate reductase/protein-tyrosine-phosphatase family protein n=1 Tax=Bittarella massiliensis (ex Durand et al. 2017) TaxID=1720313 RepID=UPI001AA1ABFB|nr:low molecular weight phosphatase family protein [Bittarella massiliensis (ex Durand et al. 2017)]MBO1679817.1 low molecular weight phosphatase family protein [Bittarella massiliensis (ex Durand et al. 2017)]